MRAVTKSLIVIVAFVPGFIIAFEEVVGKWVFTGISCDWLWELANYTLAFLPLLIALLILHRNKVSEALGVHRGFVKGIFRAFLFMLPMLLALIMLGDLKEGVTFNMIMLGIVLAGQEFFLRGYLFGQLFRFCGWGFIPALLSNALPFGVLSMYQGHDILSSLMTCGTMTMGSILYCWVYAEWKYNLWMPIALHAFINVLWVVFQVNPNATGGIGAGVFRGLTVLLIVGGTIWYKKRNSLRYEVNVRTLWRRSPDVLFTEKPLEVNQNYG